MCLLTSSNISLIAENDIVGYKVLYFDELIKKYKTEYQHMVMEIGETYSQDVDIEPEPINNKLIVGVHGVKPQYFGDKFCVGDGYYHSFCSLSDVVDYPDCNHQGYDFHIFKVIIPQGTKYFVGDFGENKSYASQSIKIIKEVKITWLHKLWFNLCDIFAIIKEIFFGNI